MRLPAALDNRAGTSLYRHELAYVLGQMGQQSAIPALVARLRDTTDDVIVRHECGEALGALGDMSVLPVLEELCSDAASEVAETCQLAVARLKWLQVRPPPALRCATRACPTPPYAARPHVLSFPHAQRRGRRGLVDLQETAGTDVASLLDASPYGSVDPTPAEVKTKTVSELRAQLLDTSLPLFDRYRAMFSLRNRGTSECALVRSVAPVRPASAGGWGVG